MEMEEKLQFAVLIDAENISARYAQMILMSWRSMDLLPADAFTETGLRKTDGKKIFYWNIP